MMRLAIEGLGLVGSFGNNPSALAENARRVLAGQTPLPFEDTSTEALKNYLPVRALRRVDHFTRMTLLSAYAAVEDAGLSPEELNDTGIVLATGYGPAKLTFDFLDSVIDFGPGMASPLAFSHSVHNIPAATVAVKMQINGPCFTVSQFETSVAAAFLTARSWMAEGRVSRVLLGAVDERTSLLEENTQRIADILPAGSKGRRIHPIGESAVFFCLHAEEAKARHGVVDTILFSRTRPDIPDNAPVFFSGAASAERRKSFSQNTYVFSNSYGNLPTAMALDAALAALALQGKLVPAIAPQQPIVCVNRDRFDNIASLTIAPREHI